MSGFDHKGQFTRDEDGGTESDPSRSVLERLHLLNLMRPPGMTHAFHRLLSVITEVCPPGSYVKKSRGRLAEDSGTSPANVKRFFDWAYSEGLMKRQKGRRGFSDRPWPDYLSWFTHAVRAMARMTDQERREKEVERLVAFGVALGADEAWERKFRESMQASKGRVKLSPPRVSVTPPGISVSPGVGSRGPRDQGQADPLEQNSNRTLKQKEGRERENGPDLEQAPVRASRPSSLSSQDQGPEKSKSTARGAPPGEQKPSTHDLHRQKLRNNIFKTISQTKASGQDYPAEWWLTFFGNEYHPADILKAYEAVYGRTES